MEDHEACWERFRSDIRGSLEIVDTKQEKPILQFHIPIRPRLPKYRPGSGPVPPRINLRPVHDSNAFIVDKVVLPRGHFHPSDHFRQRRCYYIVGWPDLPAARPVVDASKILDYVSPRTLEDWEYQDALRREEEREQEREAKKHEAAQGKAVATPIDGGLLPGAKRRPGRPPRAMMMVAEPTPEPELNSEQEEIIHKRRRGPSLSTPQKRRPAQLLAEEEEMLEELEGENAPAKTKSRKSKKKQAELTPMDTGVAEAVGSPNTALDLVQGEQDYVVKRLEDDYILNGVHWFQVRWEGDWPDDLNPTWEPRENIAEKLVKEYLKKKAKRGANRPDRPKSKRPAKTKHTNLLADWAKGYNSVADAFEGVELNATSDTMLEHGNALGGDADADDGPDELLVIDENETAATERRKAMEAEIVAQFASMARATPQHF
ncbi:hypothetical protein INS49_007718 [Diaporthe citri]|uniref:uncharacterized protein n=1 Tax=Diaporthe citri TaxID=83186 RepID=UPI001C8054F4|nr:uncharacterized protein INS49_007718 [Diaporthe citri]KAG6362626.1 hypothetical protein INS49_007718 [Diaporthe citri]